MPKIGRTLSYINTERKDKSTEQSPVSQSLGSSRPGGSVSMPQGDYLLKSIWDKVFEIRTDSQGTEYIFGKLPMVTQYGITMYSSDGVDVPSLASGLPFDGRTIWYNPDTNQIEVIGGTGGGSGEGVSNFWDLSGIPSWITNIKPKYSYSEIEGTPDLTQYATESWVNTKLGGYLPLNGNASSATKLQTARTIWGQSFDGTGNVSGNVSGSYFTIGDRDNAYIELKGGTSFGYLQILAGGSMAMGSSASKSIVVDSSGNVGIGTASPTYKLDVNGAISTSTELIVNGGKIKYDSTNKYWKLEGDLLVTGGVTMYGSDSSFTPSTIMDAIAVDGTTISKSGGVLKVIGGTGGGVADSVAWANITGKPNFASVATSGKYDDLIGKPTLLSSFTDDVVSGKYLKLSGGIIDGTLNINSVLYASSYISWKNPDNNEGGYFYGTSFNAAKNYAWTKSMLKWNVDTGIMTFEYTPLVGSSTIWHSGNDGSGSGLDADLLDGLDSSMYGQYIAKGEIPLGGKRDGFRAGKLFGASDAATDESAYRGILEYGASGYIAQFNSGIDSLYYRWCEGGIWGVWKTIAFTDSNVASATKLQTARTIWGQFFDGTGNVSGNVKGSYFTIGDRDNAYIELLGGTNYGYVQILADGSMAVGSSASSSIIVNKSGNVGIGTTSPSYKLNVNGVAKATSLYADSYVWLAPNSDAIYINSTSIAWHNSSNAWTDTLILFARNSITLNKNTTVQGNILATGGVTMYSMRSLKSVVDERGLSLSELSTIKPTRYTWKDGRDNRLHFGGIADDIQQVLPEVVYSTSDGILTMDYGNAAFAVASSLIHPVIDHEKRIAMLQERIVELEEEVERLKSA